MYIVVSFVYMEWFKTVYFSLEMDEGIVCEPHGEGCGPSGCTLPHYKTVNTVHVSHGTGRRPSQKKLNMAQVLSEELLQLKMLKDPQLKTQTSEIFAYICHVCRSLETCFSCKSF